MCFNVGDTVIIKSKEEIKKIFNIPKLMYHFVDSMFEYCNKKYIIESVVDNYITFFDNKNTYKWHYTWIKKDDFFTDEDFLI